MADHSRMQEHVRAKQRHRRMQSHAERGVEVEEIPASLGHVTSTGRRLVRRFCLTLVVWAVLYMVLCMTIPWLWAGWASAGLGLVMAAMGWLVVGGDAPAFQTQLVVTGVLLVHAIVTVLLGYIQLSMLITLVCEPRSRHAACKRTKVGFVVVSVFSLAFGVFVLFPMWAGLYRTMRRGLRLVARSSDLGLVPWKTFLFGACVPSRKVGVLGGTAGVDAEGIVRTVEINDLGANAAFPDNTVSNTKYSIWTFVPKNLAEQFLRPASFYFLLIACLQLNASLTPVSPLTTWVPLILIFTITATKDAYDDIQRHRRDKETNMRLCTVYRDGRQALIPSYEIRAGDIIECVRDTVFPADAVILQSATDGGVAFVETANLDGETDLKTRSALPVTQRLPRDDVLRLGGQITCAEPNPHIYVFNSRVLLHGRPQEDAVHALSAEQLLLQGTHLRNTDWVLAAVVYTGNQTKLGCNKKIPSTKITRADRRIDRITIFIFLLQLFLVAAAGVAGNVWKSEHGADALYLLYSVSAREQSVILPLRFLLLVSYMIPISLKVSLDIVKLAYAQFINWDAQMYDEASDTAAVAVSTAISEDLGQIEYVLTDKTGTLTENIMALRQCSIGCHAFGATSRADEPPVADSADGGTALEPVAAPSHGGDIRYDAQLALALEDPDPGFPGMSAEEGTFNRSSPVAFFTCLALCHTVEVDASDFRPELHNYDAIVYTSNSPDEEALVSGARDVGVVLVDRRVEASSVFLTIAYPCVRVNQPPMAVWEVVNVLEFSSDRKRMSVVARTESGELWVLSKGADMMMMPLLSESEQQGTLLGHTMTHVNDYAALGLRTLLLGMRALEEDAYATWHAEWHEASTRVHEREAAIAAVYEKLECDLSLIGATAIEDKLQEGVPETIATLRRAGICFWMLTGDKYATAIEIALSCNLMDAQGPRSRLVTLRDDPLELAHGGASSVGSVGVLNDPLEASLRDAQAIVHESHQQGVRVTVAVEGAALGRILAAHKELFMEVCGLSHAVICCRVSPEQKGKVVKLVKDAGHSTLAIGDGGNDVAMIQEADIGVGISGREGLQAARAADYSFARFRFLQRLVLVHGRYSYHRTAFLAQYCFYKSFYLAMVQLMYSVMFGAASGVSFFDSFALTMYNVAYTGLPVLFYCLDKDVPEPTIFARPSVYQSGPQDTKINDGTITAWLMMGWGHAFVALFVPIWVYGTADVGGGSGYTSLPMVSYTIIVLVNSLVIALYTNHMTVVNAGVLAFTIVGYFLSTLVYSSIPLFSQYGVMMHLFVDPSYWLTVLLGVVLSIAPLLVHRAGLGSVLVNALCCGSGGGMRRTHSHGNCADYDSINGAREPTVTTALLSDTGVGVGLGESGESLHRRSSLGGRV